MQVIDRKLLATEFEGTCNYCDSVFIFNILTDLILLYDGSSRDAWVKCPVCGKQGLFSSHRRDYERRIKRKG